MLCSAVGDKNMQQKHFNQFLCRLCFNLISSTNSEVTEGLTRKSVEVVFPNLNLEETHKHHMCKTCSSKLFAAFNFKLRCVDTENTIFHHINADKVPVVELKEVYVKVNGNIQLRDMLENQKICRLCFELVTGFVPLNEVDKGIIDAYLPQINISATKDPIICLSCLDSVRTHGSFVKNCIGEHEKYADANKQPYIKTEEIEFKQEDCCDVQDTYRDMGEPYIKSEEIEIKLEEGDQYNNFSSHALEDQTTENTMKEITEDTRVTKYEYMGKCERGDQIIKSKTLVQVSSDKNRDRRKAEGHLEHKIDPNPKRSVKIQMFKCDSCNYETNYKRVLITHQLKHKDPSEIQMYKCDICTFETKYKSHFKSHQVIHKDVSETQIYTCNVCTYETRYKIYLKKHQLTHKDPSEIQMYKCNSCDYETKYKRVLKVHQLTHKDPSEIQMYKCDICTFETKYSKGLKCHQLTHKDLSEIPIYRCSECDFECKRKRAMKLHQLTHKTPSEIQMYRCDECDYEGKRKADLKRHQLMHKDPSVIQMYKCDTCTYITKHNSCLKIHQLTHKDPSDIQMYTCDTCGYATYHKNSMKNHQLKHKDHSEIEMYKCGTCTFQSKYKKCLKVHMLLHKDPSKIQMYKCDTCTYKSKYKSNLKIHELAHKKNLT